MERSVSDPYPFALVPKDTSSRPITKLKRVVAPDVYARLKSERKEGRSHNLTTEELCALIDSVAKAQPQASTSRSTAPSSFPDSSAEAARLRNLQVAEKRLQLIERISTLPAPAATPAFERNPLDDLKKVSADDRKNILVSKLTATLKRFGAIKELGETDLFIDANSSHVASFRRGLDNLEFFLRNADRAVANITEIEWRSLNWGLIAIGKVSFKGLRRNFAHVLSNVAKICDENFYFVDKNSPSYIAQQAKLRK